MKPKKVVNKSLTILCDLDDIVVDLLNPWLARYNEDYQQFLTPDKITNFDLSKIVHYQCGTKIYDYICELGFFSKLSPLPGAIKGLKILQAAGHDVYLVSSPSKSPNSYKDKAIWVQEHLPFLGTEKLILTKHKHLVKGNVFIDDSSKNIKAYRKAWPDSIIFTIEYPHNQDIKLDVNGYFYGYDKTDSAWELIVKSLLF